MSFLPTIAVWHMGGGLSGLIAGSALTATTCPGGKMYPVRYGFAIADRHDMGRTCTCSGWPNGCRCRACPTSIKDK